MKTIWRVTICVYFGLPLYLSLLAVNLLSHYLSYYKIGINASANSFGLVFWELPKLLLGNFGVVFAIWYAAKRFKWSRGWVIFLGILSSIAVCTMLVWWSISSYADYPTFKDQNLGEFMDYYVRKVL
jgi:hypothetical protein